MHSYCNPLTPRHDWLFTAGEAANTDYEVDISRSLPIEGWYLLVWNLKETWSCICPKLHIKTCTAAYKTREICVFANRADGVSLGSSEQFASSILNILYTFSVCSTACDTYLICCSLSSWERDELRAWQIVVSPVSYRCMTAINSFSFPFYCPLKNPFTIQIFLPSCRSLNIYMQITLHPHADHYALMQITAPSCRSLNVFMQITQHLHPDHFTSSCRSLHPHVDHSTSSWRSHFSSSFQMRAQTLLISDWCTGLSSFLFPFLPSSCEIAVVSYGFLFLRDGRWVHVGVEATKHAVSAQRAGQHTVSFLWMWQLPGSCHGFTKNVNTDHNPCFILW